MLQIFFLKQYFQFEKIGGGVPRSKKNYEMKLTGSLDAINCRALYNWQTTSKLPSHFSIFVAMYCIAASNLGTLSMTAFVSFT